jgi:hypothetical protein
MGRKKIPTLFATRVAINAFISLNNNETLNTNEQKKIVPQQKKLQITDNV